MPLLNAIAECHGTPSKKAPSRAHWRHVDQQTLQGALQACLSSCTDAHMQLRDLASPPAVSMDQLSSLPNELLKAATVAPTPQHCSFASPSMQLVTYKV